MEVSEKADMLVFYVNGRRVAEPEPNPAATLIQYLRRKLLLTGTKEGCGHGGCGSCTVMVSKYGVVLEQLVHYSVNACLFPLCAAHGLAITTVEGVGDPRTGLHEVQKRLVESHGLQCGFCTPGFVMSAFTLLRNNPKPSRDDVEKALEGNLCRCTGYRPILDAFSSFTKEGCSLGDACCRIKNTTETNPNKTYPITVDSTGNSETQVSIFPPELRLPNEYHSRCARFTGSNMDWYRPTSLAKLVSLKDKFPDAPVVMGNTTIGKDIQQGMFTRMIYGGGIADLKAAVITEHGVSFGASVTLTELAKHIGELCSKIDEQKRKHFPSILSMVDRYGSDQIRNVATLGGSIRSGRSNSDVITLLTTLNASVIVTSVNGDRKVILEDLVLENNEVISHIVLPYSEKNDGFEFYKQADRRTFSLAIINSGMFVRLDGDKVKELRMCFGGVAQHAVLALKTSMHATGRNWNETLLHEMIPLLNREIINCNKSVDDTYKASVVNAFLFKFYMFVRKHMMADTGYEDLLKDIPLPACTSSQFYHPCTDENQPDQDPVGRPVPNVSSEAIVSGEAEYIDDIPSMQGELFLSLVLSAKPHAKITRIDPSEALAIEGVHSFIDHNDIPGTNLFGLLGADEEYFASKEVVYVGQPVGAILAEHREIAHKAARLVNVQYDDLEAILTIEEAIKAGSYLCNPVKMDNGDLEQGFGESAHVIEGEYGTGFQEHFYMEPHAIVIVPKGGDEMEIFCGTQSLLGMQEYISKLLNIPRNRITCRTKRIGGAFGGKETRSLLVAGPAAIAAHRTRRPIRCVLPRETDMLITGKRHPFIAKYKVGVDEHGHIKALDIGVFNNGGCTLDSSPMVVFCAALGLEGSYNIANIRFRGQACRTNLPSSTAMRGFGKPQAALIMEDIIFHVACTTKMSQEQIREVNLIKEGHITSWGQQLTSVTICELWNTCLASSQFEQRRQEIDNHNRRSKWKKRGLAMTTVQFGIGTGVISLTQGAALVNIYLDGSVLVSHGGIEMGQGLSTKMIQGVPITVDCVEVAARVLGVPLEKIYTAETSSTTVPNSIFTGGSMGTDLYGPAVKDACETLNKRLEPVRVKCPSATWEETIQMAFMERVQLSATGFYKPEMTFNFNLEKKIGQPSNYVTYGVVCTEVELDVLTGENQVLQSDIMFDVGKSLNPAIDIGQIEGAFVQGLGMVTSEFMDANENGRMINCSPLSYKIPNVRSIPRKLNVTLLKNYSIETAIYSSKAIGEPPLLGSASVMMAIKDAVLAARAQIGMHGYFRLDSPATVQRTKAACGDQIKI